MRMWPCVTAFLFLQLTVLVAPGRCDGEAPRGKLAASLAAYVGRPLPEFQEALQVASTTTILSGAGRATELYTTLLDDDVVIRTLSIDDAFGVRRIRAIEHRKRKSDDDLLFVPFLAVDDRLADRDWAWKLSVSRRAALVTISKLVLVNRG